MSDHELREEAERIEKIVQEKEEALKKKTGDVAKAKGIA